MSERGATNQAVEDWRAQRAPLKCDAATAAASVVIWGKRGPEQLDRLRNDNLPKPDTRDGVDLLAIILIIWVVCFIAGYLTGRY